MRGDWGLEGTGRWVFHGWRTESEQKEEEEGEGVGELRRFELAQRQGRLFSSRGDEAYLG